MDISAMLEVQVDEVKMVNSKEKVTPKDLIPSVTVIPPPISQEESSFYKLMFGNDISIVRFRKLHCTACDVHIGSAPAHADNMLEHPILRTLLCAKCREFYGDGTFEQGDDATDMFCRWCANGGNLYCCSYCSNTFCYKCIRRNFDSLVRKKIEADEKWKCFVCSPADLYSTRATCWALLQHVKTLASLLQNDSSLSPEEREERMNLDESECCPRRRKRKRRRTGSNSEDEDETYDPNINNEPIIAKRKSLKRKYKHRRLTISNGNFSRLLPSSAENNPNKPPEVSASLSSVESVVIDNTGVNPSSGLVSSVPIKTEENLLSSQSDQIIQEKIDATNTKTTYNANITAVPTVKLLQSTATFKPIQSIIASQVLAQNSFTTGYYPTTRMVTIPTQKHPVMLNRSRVLLPKPKQLAKVMMTPNVINLDSDSDEPSIIPLLNSQNIQNIQSIQNIQTIQTIRNIQKTPPVDKKITGNANPSSTIAVPVALVSTDNNINIDRLGINQVEQPLRELDTTLKKNDNSFGQIVLNPFKELFNDILDNFKSKFHQILENTQSDYTSKKSSQEEQSSKILVLYNQICDTIMQLSCVNDRIIRAYNGWERSQNIKKKVVEKSITRTSSKEENNEIPLDMVCVAESSTESDCEDVTTMQASELVLSTNVLKAFLEKKSLRNKSVGTSSIVYKDKSIQVIDFELKDYEKIIGHSVLTKADNVSLTKDGIIKSIAMPSEHIGKYEEQFIYYLQHIEDHRMELDNTSNEVALESFIDIEKDSDISETLINEIPSDNLNKFNELNDFPSSPKNHENSKTKNINNAESILSSVSNNLKINEIPTNKENINIELEKECTTTNNTINEKPKLNVRKAIETVISSLINNETNSTGNLNISTAEDDITIIED